MTHVWQGTVHLLVLNSILRPQVAIMLQEEWVATKDLFNKTTIQYSRNTCNYTNIAAKEHFQNV